MITKQPSCTDIDEQGMLHFDAAQQEILTSVGTIKGVQRLPIEQTSGRTLGVDIVSPINVPAHTNSAVDGFAIRSADLPENSHTAKFEIVGTALAGKPFKGNIGARQGIRIMTGAVVPSAADTVIMLEHTEQHDNFIRIEGSHRRGQNIRPAGEDLQQNQVVLHSGKWLTPADIGLIASLGITEIDVKRKLSVAVASTGEEIINIGTTAKANSIYDSNRYSIMTALDRPDIEVIDLGIVQDDATALMRKFNEAALSADLIISSGGVSVGDADFTTAALRQSGKIKFRKVAIKPGRPLTFGSVGGIPFFGLPGNPVAVMVTFYLFVIPALEKMLGINNKPVRPLYQAKVLESIKKKPGRTEIQRGILEAAENGEWTVKTTGKQGSGILHSMSLANAFIILPHDRATVHAGEMVTVQPFSGLI